MFVSRTLAAARQRLAIVGTDATIADVASLLSQEHINLAIACNSDGTMAGVVTDSDVVRAIARCHLAPEKACASGAAPIMTRDVMSCRPEDDLSEVWDAMKRRGLRHIPVLDEYNKPIGVLYARDILGDLFEEMKIEAADLRDFFLGVGYR